MDEYNELFGITEFEETPCIENEDSEKCEHVSTSMEGGKRMCDKCGCEVLVIDYEAEWKYHGKPTSRCTSHREPERGKNLRKVFDDLNLSNGFVNERNFKKCQERYNRVVGPKRSVHGVKSRGIAAACLYHIFKEDGKIYRWNEAQGWFNLTPKQLSDGMSEYRKTFPESRIENITVSQMISRNVEILKLDKSHETIIQSLAKRIEETKAEINRSSPASIAAAVIYVYLAWKEPTYKISLDLTREKFAMMMGISGITIGKMSKIIAKILGVEMTADN
jgi:transcription initiation factor TFIIIB Brf1 subunit/transcription initiation factor TFIIB